MNTYSNPTHMLRSMLTAVIVGAMIWAGIISVVVNVLGGAL